MTYQVWITHGDEARSVESHIVPSWDAAMQAIADALSTGARTATIETAATGLELFRCEAGLPMPDVIVRESLERQQFPPSLN